MLEAANTPPIAKNDVFSTRAGEPILIRAEALLQNDSDPDGNTLTVTGIGDVPNAYAYYDPDKGYEYLYFEPDDFFVGTSVFNYTITDGNGGTATAAITVNIEAEQLGSLSVTSAEDARAIVTKISLSSMNTEIVFSQPEHGQVTIELVDGGPGANVIYIPETDYNGPDNFTISYLGYSDGSVSQKQVYLNVTPVDEPTPTASYVRGTAGADTLDYASATTRVQIAGLEGNDTLRGGAGNDALNGGAGNDILAGGAGNDSIMGGLGADRMGGGGGNDTFHIALGDIAVSGATDLIVDFQGAGQAGGDLIRFTGFAAGSTLELVGTSGNARVYEVQDGAGLSEGQILVSAGGALGQVLTTSDYAFA